MEKEFFLMRPSFKKNEIMDNWTDTLVKLDNIFCKDEDEALILWGGGGGLLIYFAYFFFCRTSK